MTVRYIDEKHEACGSGPVIIEDHGKGWRAICCFCWTHGPTRTDRENAVEAWGDGSKRVEWREPTRAKTR